MAVRIVAFGRARLAARGEYANIASAIGVAPYAAIAEEIAVALPGGRVLDWGAGWGQTSLLLAARGVRVVAYDVEDKGAATGLLAGTGVAYVVAPGPRLPFEDATFDGVLNCGVLEHVEDPAAALAELRRVLRPQGRLFTYHLPNRHAWTEWLGRRLGRFHHERTYTRGEAPALFEAAGFRVVVCRPFHWLPRNVWGRSPRLAALAARGVGGFEALDRALLAVPGLRGLATAWALVAERPS
ncbi:MAG: methyltransferase domain-containing protein [Candidatus Rokubacteria bacterium]|nr:methyltransferase domain-containing protein [Candidatus Rokubacteria bacterium]